MNKEIDVMIEGKALTIPYGRSLEKAPYFGMEYAQDIEPAGEYMNHIPIKNRLNILNHEYGIITFQKPLVIEHESTCHGGWKTKLSLKYNNKKGKWLSKSVIRDGYDAIITIDSNEGCFMEIVNLKGVKENIIRS